MGTSSDRRFHGYRFPAVIIGEVVWLRFRFNLSLRDIPDLMAARGIVLSHQTEKNWCDTFGAADATCRASWSPTSCAPKRTAYGGRAAPPSAW